MSAILDVLDNAADRQLGAVDPDKHEKEDIANRLRTAQESELGSSWIGEYSLQV